MAELLGRSFVVTRAAAQAAELVAAIERRGGVPVVLPMLQIVEPEDGGAHLRETLSASTGEDWLVVLSPNGAARVAGSGFRGRTAAVGPSTAAALRDAQHHVDLVPEVPTGLGLLDAFANVDVPGRVIIAQAQGGRRDLIDGLDDRGIEVVVCIAYRNIQPTLDPEQIELARRADAAIFASPSAVRRYVAAVGVKPRVAACIGPVTAETAADVGFEVLVADAPDAESLVAVLA